MAHCRQMIWCFPALLALVRVGGCSARARSLRFKPPIPPRAHRSNDRKAAGDRDPDYVARQHARGAGTFAHTPSKYELKGLFG